MYIYANYHFDMIYDMSSFKNEYHTIFIPNTVIALYLPSAYHFFGKTTAYNFITIPAKTSMKKLMDFILTAQPSCFS